MSVATGRVVTGNVTEVAPAGIVMLAGFGRAFLFEVENTTDIPPAGAGPFVPRVPVADVPPTSGFGDTVSVDMTTGLIVSVADWVDVPYVAVMLAVDVAETEIVVMVNVAEVDPAGTVTDAGSVAFVLLEVRLTVMPPDGATPFKVTVPVDVSPPTTVLGFNDTLVTAGGLIVSVVVLVVLPVTPEMVAATELDTAVVEMVNVADVAPAATDTVAGTVAFVELDESETTIPPEPAGPVKVTVPVEDTPPMTVLGATEMLAIVGGLMVSVAVLVTPPAVAVMVAVVTTETVVVLIVKVAEVAPAAIVTVAGSVALVELDESVTDSPPGPAGPVKVSVPVEEVPPANELGASVSVESVAGLIVNVAV